MTGADLSSVMVERLVADFLVDQGPDLQLVPSLAASWERSADGKVITFHLRPGVRFHDSAPFTSDDVVFTWQKIVDPASRAVGRVDAFLPIASVEAVDPLTVRVTYKEAFAPALRGWQIPILPAHLYRGADFATAAANRAPVGTGPFRFVSWDAGRSIVLEANRDYWGGAPGLAQFVFQIVPAADTAFQALLAGEVDYARLPAARQASLMDDAAFTGRFRVLRSVPLFFYYIAWRGDGSNPFFADPRTRRALAMAIDREGYVASVLRGLGEMTDSPFAPLLPAPRARGPAHDPAAAAALLDEAGWRLDPKSGLRKRAGRTFRFTLLVFTGGEDHVQFSQVVQENLRGLGIEMRIERLDWQTLWTRLKSGDFEAAFSGFVPGPDPDSVYGLLHSSQIAGGQNYAAWRDPAVDAALDTARHTLDDTARMAIYRSIESRVLEAQPYAFLFAPVVLGAVNGRFEGAIPSPAGFLGHRPGAAALRPAVGAPQDR
ncbi:MAG TPA: ABC transporter substrate-binding protein [Dongiaceae bacterium]|nr:ABC transporter substrate-binding protein [Dongiaceae bacterium]